MSELYTFTVDGFSPDHFKVHVFTGRETISEPYAFDIVVTSDGTDQEVERLALGQRAVLSWNIGMTPRAFYGVLAAVELEEVHETAPRSARYHMRLVPRLWLLKRKRRTRIFQQMRVRDIVDAVLGEVGIATRWALLRDHPVREYCTQYEESDYRFLTRLLAEAGIYFSFPQGPLAEDNTAAAHALIPGDSLLFGDDASGYSPIGKDERDELATGSAAPPLYFLAMQQTKTSHADKVTRFSSRTTVRASTATFRDYDPERPMARLVSTAESTQPFPKPERSILDTVVAAFTSADSSAPAGLEVYEHHGPFLFPKWSFAKEEAPLILRQKRRRASVATGDSGCPDLAPGHRFGLENHPGTHLNREYVVTTVEHRGEARPQGETEWRTYRNTFTCAPAEVTYIPPRPKRRSVQVALTALVVGPPGEEIHVDALGQIKVKFHWDRDGGYDDRSSCWIRTMHAWGGAGWGAQFIPRVGMEVVVVFEGGDTDKPMILGSLYNGTHPPPFLLPGDKTRSGWRTQSSPGGGGNNELSFEDAAAKEQIYVHAQRDLDEVVERNHTLLVRGDERLRVLGSRMDIVEGDMIARVGGNEEEHVAGDRTMQVEGNRIDVVTGNSDERVSGMLVTRVEGKERRCVEQNADLAYSEDLTLRVAGCMTTLVGKVDRKRSWATHAEGTVKLSSLDSTEVSSEGELVFRVGKSSIRITSDKIELISAAVTAKGEGAGLSMDDAGMALSSKADAQLIVEKKLVIMTKDGASLSMEKEVKIDGKKILLNSPEQAQDPPPKDPEPPTTVELTDDEGKPLAYQRFLVKLDDGSDVSGMTDEAGKAEIELKTSGKVIFPEATLVGDESDKGEMRPYVVRQGDYLTRLAWMHGFDVDEVWNDPKNEDLKKRRDDKHDILAPGDVLQLPVKKKAGLPIQKGSTNQYQAKVPKVEVSLVFQDSEGNAMAKEPCGILGLGAPGDVPTDTDGDGKLTLQVPVTMREIAVHFPRKNVTHRVRIGDMDPAGEASGIQKRLQNLGLWHDASAVDGDAGVFMEWALRIFQAKTGIDSGGEFNDDTRKALLDTHKI